MLMSSLLFSLTLVGLFLIPVNNNTETIIVDIDLENYNKSLNKIIDLSEVDNSFDYSALREYKFEVLSDIMTFISIQKITDEKYSLLVSLVSESEDDLYMFSKMIASSKSQMNIDYFVLQYLLVKNSILTKSQI